MSRNKVNEIPSVYLRKKRVYMHLTRVCEFGGLEVLVVRVNGQGI